MVACTVLPALGRGTRQMGCCYEIRIWP
jgi:hypothetical protein